MNQQQEKITSQQYIKKWIYSMFEAYFAEKNVAVIADALDSAVVHIDIHDVVAIKGKNAVIKRLKKSINNHCDLKIADFNCDIVELTNGEFCQADGIITVKTAKALPNDDVAVLRFSFTLKLNDMGNHKILHSHLSLPNLTEINPNFSETIQRKLSKQQLRFEEQEEEYSTFLNSMPGAAIACENDKNFTINFMSEGFFRLFEYTKEEIEDLFNNEYINLIHPEERQSITDTIKFQLKGENAIEIEYRVMLKSGKIIWVLERGKLVKYPDGREVIYCLVMDITHLKKAQQELKLSLERHQIIMDQTNDIVFEWDLEQDTIYFSPNWQKTFGYDPVTQNIDSTFFSKLRIYNEDLQGFYDMISKVLEGHKYLENECRLQHEDGHYIWLRIKATAQHDTDGKPVKVVGVIIDIDKEKRNNQRLLRQAETDPLTKLYNKMACEELANNYFKYDATDQIGALLVLDADYFKSVNDIKGHYYGDCFLTEIANTLKNITNKNDIVGRVGGDEFVILLKNIFVEDYAGAKAGEIVEAFHKISFMPDIKSGSKSYTCSIGAAIYPKDGTTYTELFKKADEALYEAKKKGRDQFILYKNEETK